MSDIPPPLPSADARPRSIWMRGLLMLILALCYQLASTLLGLLALMQFVLVLLTRNHNERLSRFSSSMGQYLRQIAAFMGFASEEPAFPFSDWPSA